MNNIFILIFFMISVSLLAVVGIFYLIFNIVLKKTNFRIKTELEQDSYDKLSRRQKLKYIASIIFCGISLGVFLFMFVPQ